MFAGLYGSEASRADRVGKIVAVMRQPPAYLDLQPYPQTTCCNQGIQDLRDSHCVLRLPHASTPGVVIANFERLFLWTVRRH